MSGVTYILNCPVPGNVNWNIPKVDNDILKIGFLNILSTYRWHREAEYREKYPQFEWSKRSPAVIELITMERPAVLGLCELDLEQLKDLEKAVLPAGALQNYHIYGFASQTGETIQEAKEKYRDDEWKKYQNFVALLVDKQRIKISNSPKCHQLPACKGQRWNRVLLEAHLVDLAANQAFAMLVTHYDHVMREARDQSCILELKLIEDLEKQGIPWISVGDRNYNFETAEAEAKPFVKVPYVVDARNENQYGCFGVPGTFIHKKPLTLVTIDICYRSRTFTQGVLYYTRIGKYDPQTSKLLRDGDPSSAKCISDHFLLISCIRLIKKPSGEIGNKFGTELA